MTAAVAIETLLGLGLALLCLRELPFIRAMRLVLIVPMVVTPVVVGIVFRLIYASDVGLLSVALGARRRRLGRHPRQREPRVLGPRRCSTCGSGRR